MMVAEGVYKWVRLVDGREDVGAGESWKVGGVGGGRGEECVGKGGAKREGGVGGGGGSSPNGNSDFSHRVRGFNRKCTMESIIKVRWIARGEEQERR